jgi:hypothetical protein
MWVKELGSCTGEHKFRVFENKVLGIIFEPKSEMANG